MATTVLIADDHGVVREGLRAALEARGAVRVVAEARTGLEAVRLATELSPDVVIMDIRMSDLNGIEATRRVRSEAPASKVIALSAYADRRCVAEMLSAGAVGYVLKGSCVSELATAIEVVRTGGIYLSPSIADTVVEDYLTLRADNAGSAWTLLSSRERQVLQMLAEGLNTKTIAHRLSLSPRTIERHRSRLMEKLGVDSVAELTKYALREGIVSLDG